MDIMTQASEERDMRPAACAVERCPEHFARPTIERHHYLQRWPDPRSLPFAYRLLWQDTTWAPDGTPWGLVVMKKPQHHKQSGLFGCEGLPTAWQVLDLARVWVNPILQAVRWRGPDRHGREVEQGLNIFSQMISLVVKRVQVDWILFHPPVFPDLPYHIRLIISYCDRRHHQGVGYRAAGFEFWRETQDGEKDLYIRRLRRPSWSWHKLQSLTRHGMTGSGQMTALEVLG